MYIIIQFPGHSPHFISTHSLQLAPAFYQNFQPRTFKKKKFKKNEFIF